MAKGAYIGVNGAARKVTAEYIGVGGVARKVEKSYVGVNGAARESWAAVAAPPPPPPDEWTAMSCVMCDYELYPISEIMYEVAEVYGYAEPIDEVQGARVGDEANVQLGTPSDMTITECYGRNGWALFEYNGAYFFAYDYIDDEDRMFCNIFE